MGFAKYDNKKVTKDQLTIIGNERTRYFDNIGKSVKKATDVETAIELSGLNFEVQKYPIAFKTQVEQPLNNGTSVLVDVMHDFPNQFATVRSDTLEPLGVVGKNYEILQNLEAFDFLDSMTMEAKFETAGSYGPNGAKSFITMSTEPMKILGDEFTPYILFTNSFDGSGSVRAMFTPIRVFCSNCLTRAMRNGTNKINIRHGKTLKYRLEAAREVLLGNTAYLEAVKAEAEKMAITPFTNEQFKAMVTNMFMTKDGDSDLVKARNEAMVSAIMSAYNQADLQNYNNTAYKAVQAMADFESHKPAFRNTSTIQYKNISNIMLGMPLTNAMADRIMSA